MPVRTFNAINRVPGLIEGQLDTFLATVAAGVEADAKQRAPVDTGHLRASIGMRRVAPLMFEVVASAHYALYVEMGTRFTRAQPFMAPAIDGAAKRLRGAAVTFRVVV